MMTDYTDLPPAPYKHRTRPGQTRASRLQILIKTTGVELLMAAGWWMVVAGIGRTCFALSHVYLSSAACGGMWSGGEWWGVVGDQLIIYLDVGPLPGPQLKLYGSDRLEPTLTLDGNKKMS